MVALHKRTNGTNKFVSAALQLSFSWILSGVCTKTKYLTAPKAIKILFQKRLTENVKYRNC